MNLAAAPNGNAITDALRKDCEWLGLSVTEEVLQQLHIYLQQLQRWNRTYNLTAIREPEAMRVQHVADSLAVIPVLKKLETELAATDTFRLLDVGSGGGLPGVVIAIMCPTWQVVCVDAVAKKVSFIQQVARVLGLKNLQAQHARVEALSLPPSHVVVSRAFASMADFATLAGNHVMEGGVLLAMKGRHPQDEILELQQRAIPWQVTHVEQLEVPGLQAERCVVTLRRVVAVC